MIWAFISNVKQWGVITHPYPNVPEVRAWMSNYIPCKPMAEITDECPNMLVTGPLAAAHKSSDVLPNWSVGFEQLFCGKKKNITFNMQYIPTNIHAVYDDGIKWKHFCVTGPLWGETTGHRWIPLTKASDAELWYFLWSKPEQTIGQTIKTQVIWDAVALIMTSL